jgi:hypothetical protein
LKLEAIETKSKSQFDQESPEKEHIGSYDKLDPFVALAIEKVREDINN